jgi:hypothetical protein
MKTSLFLQKRLVYMAPPPGGEAAETPIQTSETRDQLREKYSDPKERQKLYEETEKAAQDIIHNPTAGGNAKEAAQKLLDMTAKARDNEKKYNFDLDSAYFMNEEAASLRMRYLNLLRIANGENEEALAARPRLRPAQNKAPVAAAALSDAEAQKAFDELNKLDAATRRAWDRSDTTKKPTVPDPAAQLDALGNQTNIALRNATSTSAIGDVETSTPTPDMPLAQPSATESTRSLNLPPTKPVQTSETAKKTQAARSAEKRSSGTPLSPAGAPISSAGEAPVVAPPNIAAPEASPRARTEILNVNELPPNVYEAYTAFTKNQSSLSTVETDDAKYYFERGTSTITGADRRSASIARVKVYKESKS